MSRKEIQKILYASIDTTPALAKRFFKTKKNDYAAFDKFLGIKAPTLRKIAKKYTTLTLKEIEDFFNSEFNEERLFALIVLVMQYEKANISEKENIYQFYLKNIAYVNNWNLVDNSAHHIMGAHLWQQERKILLAFAGEENLWKRRISIVATWYFIKRKDFSWTELLAQHLINDKEDLIHKAVGWMLREVGKQNESVLINFLNTYAGKMPRTMLRYAIEKFSASLRKQYLHAS